MTTTFLPNGKVDTRLLDTVALSHLRPPSFLGAPRSSTILRFLVLRLLPSTTLYLSSRNIHRPFHRVRHRNLQPSTARTRSIFYFSSSHECSTSFDESIISLTRNVDDEYFERERDCFFRIGMIRGNETIRDPIKMPRIDNRWMSGPFRSPTTSIYLTSCVAAVSLDDDLVDALIGSITGHIISFKAFHHRSHYL